MTNPNDPAFKTDLTRKDCLDDDEMCFQGLTKREEFAKAAMQGILANDGLAKSIHDKSLQSNSTMERGVSVFAINMADALIAALNKASEGRDGG